MNKLSECIGLGAVLLLPGLALAQDARFADNAAMKCWAAAGASINMSSQVKDMQMGEDIPAAVAQTQAVSRRAKDKVYATLIKGNASVEEDAVQALVAMIKTERGFAVDFVGKSLKDQGVGEAEMKAGNLWLKKSAEYFSQRYKKLKCL